MNMSKILLTVEETREYLGIGETMTRKLMRDEGFGCKIGNRLYSNKVLLDEWLVKKCKRK